MSRSKVLKKGFTLIELLVVIAIIAILASILFPVFAKARENARRASCQSGMKQVALGVIQYIQDNDEYFYYQSADAMPVGGSVGGAAPGGLPMGNPAGRTYADELHPYIKSEQIWRCPSSILNNNAAPAQIPNRVAFHLSGMLNGKPLAAIAAPAMTDLMRDTGSGTAYDICYLRPVPVDYNWGKNSSAGTTGTSFGGIPGERAIASPTGQNGPHFDGYNI
ncbi:MAG: prepilin-type N-terminal cleavage/methylation domain-containing protein, partial [Abitibacteriaceae bacterium]|nr:prepilin-type N-terminal cleavage/methylation domain-containing protein [Abditibacteriaceae bacterium]